MMIDSAKNEQTDIYFHFKSEHTYLIVDSNFLSLLKVPHII